MTAPDPATRVRLIEINEDDYDALRRLAYYSASPSTQRFLDSLITRYDTASDALDSTPPPETRGDSEWPVCALHGERMLAGHPIDPDFYCPRCKEAQSEPRPDEIEVRLTREEAEWLICSQELEGRATVCVDPGGTPVVADDPSEWTQFEISSPLPPSVGAKVRTALASKGEGNDAV